MIPSLLPLKITAAIATCAIALIAYTHGAVDGQAAMTTIGALFTFLVGVITHNDNTPPPAAR